MHNPEITKIDVTKLLRIIYKDKKLFLTLIISFGLFGVFYSLTLDNIYKSESILLANDQSSGFNENNSVFSILAGETEKNSADIAMESLLSEDFFRQKIFSNKDLLNEFTGAKTYDSKKDQVTFKESLFYKDEYNNRTLKSGYSVLDSTLDFKKIFSMEYDKRSGFYIISAEHTSPELAQRWLKIVLRNLDDYMKIKESKRSSNSISALEDLLVTTSSVDVRRSISRLIERELKVLVLAEASDYYIFNVVQSPTLPLLKDRPARSIICIFIFIVGFILTTLIVLIRSNSEPIKEKISFITSA